MGAFSFSHIILVLLVALIVFGPKKLPEVGRTLGSALREFRKASREFSSCLEDTGSEIEHESKPKDGESK